MEQWQEKIVHTDVETENKQTKINKYIKSDDARF